MKTQSQLPKLLVRPSPDPEESLTGYALRVAERNGLRGFGQWLQVLGHDCRTHVTKSLVPDLVAMLGVSDDGLNAMAYDMEKADKTCWVRGDVRLPWRDVSPRWARLCPACVQETGRTRAIWDIWLVSACPVHAVQLVDCCPGCGWRLTWTRPGLARCKCGRELKPSDTKVADDAALVLASLIQHKLGWGEMPAPKSVPAEIATLSQADLMDLIRYLALLAMPNGKGARQKFEVNETHRLASSVGLAIVNWPHGLHETLSKALSRLADERSFVSVSDIAQSTVGGFQRWASSPKAPECVRREVSQFFSAYRFANGKQTIYLSPQADPGVVHTIMAPERAFETISDQAARHVLGISHGWFKRFVKLGVIRKVPRLRNDIGIGIVEKKSIDALASLLGSVVSAHEACKILGINQYQLAALKLSGVLQVAIGGRCNVLSGRYAVEALHGLLGQLEQLAMSQPEAKGNTTVLSAYYRSEFNKQRFQSFIRAILEQRLKIYRLDHGTTAGLGNFAVVSSEANAQDFHLPCFNRFAYGGRT